jgi:hypothetical protein
MTERKRYAISKETPLPHDEAVDKARSALQEKG